MPQAWYFRVFASSERWDGWTRPREERRKRKEKGGRRGNIYFRLGQGLFVGGGLTNGWRERKKTFPHWILHGSVCYGLISLFAYRVAVANLSLIFNTFGTLYWNATKTLKTKRRRALYDCFANRSVFRKFEAPCPYKARGKGYSLSLSSIPTLWKAKAFSPFSCYLLKKFDSALGFRTTKPGVALCSLGWTDT